MKKLIGLLVIVFSLFLFSTQKTFAAQGTPGVWDVVEGKMALTLWGCGLPDSFNTGPMCETGGTNLETWFGGDPEENNDEANGGGAINSVITMINATYTNPPASSAYYVADLIQNSSLVPQAYAQGVGFGSLTPILPIWKAFRNIAYFLYVIIFVVVGFAIMFRAKLNPQTVISIQSALPKLIITLLLITFSYAIAGLMIDLMYLVIYLIVGLFDTFVFNKPINELVDIALNNNIWTNMLNFIVNPSSMVTIDSGSAVEQIFDNAIQLPELLEWLDDFLSVPLGVIMFLVFSVAIFIAMFKVFFMLLSAYINIIMAIIFSPLTILMNNLPGSTSFNKWLRGLAANLAIFPVVITMMLIGSALLGNYNATDKGIGLIGNIAPGSGESNGFVPPQLGGTGSSSPIQGLIGIGIIMLLPEAAKITKKAMGVEESGLAQAALGNLGKGAAPFVGPAKTGASWYKQTALGNIYQGAATGGFGGALSATKRAFNPVGTIGDSLGLAKTRAHASMAEQSHWKNLYDKKHGGGGNSGGGNSEGTQQNNQASAGNTSADI